MSDSPWPARSLLLAIETSCDDTSVALVAQDGAVAGLFAAHQDLVHRPYGGIVPEIASRSHTETLIPLIECAIKSLPLGWSTVAGLAVTAEPGLVGSLMVGVVTAKSLALARGLPLVAVNHIAGHLLAPLLKDDEFQAPADFIFPYLGLVVSGGHTSLIVVEGSGDYRVLGQTRDDAAGEAFDKTAKMLGLGYPGGIQIDRLSQGGNATRFALPRSLLNPVDNLDFSFSGLKTAVHKVVQTEFKMQLPQGADLADLCASIQMAIVDVLIEKIQRAVRQTGLVRVALTGGVSSNSHLRSRGAAWALAESQRRGHPIQLVVPPLRYCTDNAAMIGRAGWLKFLANDFSDAWLAPSAQSRPHSGFRHGR